MSSNDNFFKRGVHQNTTVPVTTDPYERNSDSNDGDNGLEKDRRAVKMVCGFMERSDAYRTPHLAYAIQSRSLYENWQDDGKTLTGRARMRSSVGFNIIETLTPQLHAIFFQDDEIISLEGKDVFAADLEIPMSEHVNRQLKNTQIKTKGYAYNKAMLLDGTAIAKIPYRYEEKEVIKRTRIKDPITGLITTIKEPKLEAEFDGPDVELISIQDFFPDWSIRVPGDIKNMRGCAHRSYMTITEIANDGRFKNIDQLKTSVGRKGTKTWMKSGKLTPHYWTDDFRQEHDRLMDNYSEAKSAGKIEVWEYWGLYDPKGDGDFKPYVLTVANGDVLIQERENPFDERFKPFVATPNYPRDGEFYGIPELIMQKYSIKELNTLKNARLDSLNLSTNPMWKVSRNSGLNVKQFISKPGGVVLLDEMDGLQPLSNNDPSGASANEMAAIQQEISSTAALGIATSTLGEASKTLGRTTSGVGLITSFADNRINLKATILSETFLQPMVEMFLKHNRQFTSQDVPVKMSNPELAQVDPDAIIPVEAFSVDFGYKVKTDFDGGSLGAMVEKLNVALPLIQAVEATNPGTIKSDVIINQLFRRLFKTSLPRFVNSPEERQQLQAQQLAAEQAANAQRGRDQAQPNAEIEDDSELTEQEILELAAKQNV